MEDQDLVVDGFGLQRCVFSSPVRAQTAGGETHGVEDLPRQPGLHAGLSAEGTKRILIEGTSGPEGPHLRKLTRPHLYVHGDRDVLAMLAEELPS